MCRELGADTYGPVAPDEVLEIKRGGKSRALGKGLVGDDLEEGDGEALSILLLLDGGFGCTKSVNGVLVKPKAYSEANGIGEELGAGVPRLGRQSCGRRADGQTM